MSPLPAWVDFKPVRADWVEVLEWWAADGRSMTSARAADRTGRPRPWMSEQCRKMHGKGLLDRVKGWDGVMYSPSDHGRTVAERGY